MGGPHPAFRAGVAGLVAHDPSDATDVLRIIGTDAGALKVSSSTGKKTFTYDGSDRIQTIAIEHEVNGGTVTETYTFSYGGNNLVSEISAAVVT